MRILLVEDEEKVSRFIVRGLKAEGYAIDAVLDAQTAQDYLVSYEYDAVILDLNLPGMSGSDLLQHIRRTNTKVPVLILTARDGVDDKVSNFERGADDYLTKPFAFAELVVRIKALLRRGPVERASVLNIEDLRLNRIAHLVHRKDALIDLTSKEFALLEYMMVNAGRVLSRTMIIEHVWDQSFEGLTNIVDVYIRQLRRKIDEEHELKLIRTVRGVGYAIGFRGFMKHPRSIRARLITLYVVTLSLIFVCFGGYTYWGFKQYLVTSLRQALSRRAQIAETILVDVPQRGEIYVGSEIRARYAPELNERVIRVTDLSGRVVYASSNAGPLLPPPPVTFTGSDAETEPIHREEQARSKERLQVMAIGYQVPNGDRYVVEVGAPENEISSALEGLMITLLLGFPVFIGLTSVGAYVLLGRALRPVDEIVPFGGKHHAAQPQPASAPWPAPGMKSSGSRSR